MQKRYFQGVMFLAVCPLVLWAGLELPQGRSPVSDGIFLGSLISVLNGLACFTLLHWSFRKTARVFYASFFGGMIWKIAVLGSAFWILPRFPSVHRTAAFVSLALMTFLINILEIRFLPE